MTGIVHYEISALNWYFNWTLKKSLLLVQGRKYKVVCFQLFIDTTGKSRNIMSLLALIYETSEFTIEVLPCVEQCVQKLQWELDFDCNVMQ
jgi:hypothetical protein